MPLRILHLAVHLHEFTAAVNVFLLFEHSGQHLVSARLLRVEHRGLYDILRIAAVVNNLLADVGHAVGEVFGSLCLLRIGERIVDGLLDVIRHIERSDKVLYPSLFALHRPVRHGILYRCRSEADSGHRGK